MIDKHKTELLILIAIIFWSIFLIDLMYLLLMDIKHLDYTGVQLVTVYWKQLVLLPISAVGGVLVCKISDD